MLRVWIVFALVLVVGIVIGVWLASRARRKAAGNAAKSRTIGPDDDATFLRSINIDPESLDESGNADDGPKGSA